MEELSSSNEPSSANNPNFDRSPSPPTNSWPLTKRLAVRSCYEFPTTSSSQTTPISESYLNPFRRVSNPFLLDLCLAGEEIDADEDDDDELSVSTTSNSLSLLSNDDNYTNNEDDDTLSSHGNLSEVFDSLSRFSQMCLASVEALCSPIENSATTPKATCSNYSFEQDHNNGFPSCSSSIKNNAEQAGGSGVQCRVEGSNEISLEEESSILVIRDERSFLALVQEASSLSLHSPNWEERCLELEVALQRFGEQAARVRIILRDKLAEYERRVITAENRAQNAEEKVRVMEQQLSEATSGSGPSSRSGIKNPNVSSWSTPPPDPSPDAVCTLQNAVREKERVISRLECQVEEQRLLRLQESRQVEEKAAKIKEWVSNKLRDLEDQNELLRGQNQRCETQLELLRTRLTQLSQLGNNSKSKDRLSTEDSSRGSYEGDRPGSDESSPPGSNDETRVGNGSSIGIATRPLSATAACLAAIRRRSGAFDTPEERRQRRQGSLSHERLSRDSRSSRVDSGSVDMETPQSLSPRSPLNTLEDLNSSLSHTIHNHHHHNNNNNISQPPSQVSQISQISHNSQVSQSSQNGGGVHSVPLPTLMSLPSPTPIYISEGPADVVMEGGTISTQSLTESTSTKRVPIVPPRRCRTRSPTPNTSKGTTPGSEMESPPCGLDEDPSLLRARLDAECQQLARDLQAAVRELVRPDILSSNSPSNQIVNEGVNGVSGNSSENYAHGQGESNGANKLQLAQPPPPPIHRFPSWESRIYEVAAGGLKNASSSTTQLPGETKNKDIHSHTSFHSLAINFSVPVYTTVKGRASQIRSGPFSGDTSDSSDGEEGGGSGGSGGPISHHLYSSCGDTDSLSSPPKTTPSSTHVSLSPNNLVLNSSTSPSPSKYSIRREISFESEMSDDYAIPPDAFGSERSSLDIALSSGISHSNLNSNSNAHSTLPTLVNSSEGGSSPLRKESLEKSGYLTKLGGKFKTWRKRWFVLKNGTLTYWKSPHDVHRRSIGREIELDENCRIMRGEGSATFEITTQKKTYYLTADSILAVDDWVRVLQNVLRRNATKLVLSMEDSKATIQGWVVKVKNGHAKRCWCVLVGKMFLTFKNPSDNMASGQINMKDARVEDVEHVSDSDTDEKEGGGGENIDERESDPTLTLGIFPTHQSPIYLHLPTKQEKDSWLYHLTIVSGMGPSAGTQFEQIIHKLMEVDGDPNSPLWKNPLLLHSKESISSPLTSVSSEALQNEAVKLFKSCQLFMSVPLDSSGIDYHVALAQNALQLCVDYSELQAEILCALVKQTSKATSTHKNSPHASRALNKIKHSRHFLLNATQSLFLCDSTPPSSKLHSSPNGSINGTTSAPLHKNNINSSISSPTPAPRGTKTPHSLRSSPSKSNSKPHSSFNNSTSKTKSSSSSVPSSPLLSSRKIEGENIKCRNFVFVQGWQLLALAVSLFLPKNNKLLWYLKQHLLRNIDTKSETGKYAAYCQRAIERTLKNGSRLYRPSRMEVLSIIIKNPFHHSHPHSIPVHFLNGAYQVVNFDGSSTVEEFLISLCSSIGCRDPSQSGFSLFEDDPFEKDLEHSLLPNEKICDVISQWETILREKGSGKFETRRSATLSFKLRLYRRSGILQETDKERVLLCYQTNQAVVHGKFPLSKELALELAALMAQIDGGDYNKSSKGSSQLLAQLLDKYYPSRYRENLSSEESKALSDSLVQKWTLLKGKSGGDCVRIYLTCTRKWAFFGASLFSVYVHGTHTMEDGTNIWAAIYQDGIALLDSQSLQQIGRYSYASVQTFGGALDDHFMFVVDDQGKKRRILFTGMSKIKVLEMTRLVADYINACIPHSVCGTSSSRLTRHSSLKSTRLQNSGLPPTTPKPDRKYLGESSSSSSSRSPNPIQRCDSLQTRRSPKP